MRGTCPAEMKVVEVVAKQPPLKKTTPSTNPVAGGVPGAPEQVAFGLLLGNWMVVKKFSLNCAITVGLLAVAVMVTLGPPPSATPPAVHPPKMNCVWPSLES